MVTAAVFLGTVENAAATTICVPSVAVACAGTPGAVDKADIEEAMSFQASDGTADTIRIAAGTYSDNGAFEPLGGSDKTYEPTGSDPLSIVGAGLAATILTSTGTTNIYAVNLSFNNTRVITIRDLSVQAPASFPDGQGAAILLYNGDALEGVDVVSLNKESTGVVDTGAGNAFRNGEVRGGGGGSVSTALSASSSGTMAVEDATIRNASWALYAGSGGSLTARRVSVVGASTYGAISSDGQLLVENSTFTLDDGIGLYVSASAPNATLTANHVTILNAGSSYPALEGKKFSSSAGNATLLASNSIFRGFSTGYKTETPFGPGIGVVSVTARYSNIPQTGASVGGTANFATGNIQADPLLAGDLSLPVGSPSIDAGDPAPGGLATDFLGAPRPRDGNGDGVSIRDQGAFEYQPPSPSPTGGGSGGGGGAAGPVDAEAPQTMILKGPGSKLVQGKARFAFRSSEPNSTFSCKLDRRKVRACTSPKPYTGLKPGRHVFRVWATDAAGNKSALPAKRRFRVPTSA